MKVAIPLWQGRVSPVFDEASSVLVVDVIDGRAECRQKEGVLVHSSNERAHLLLSLEVDLLICGMISQAQQAALNSVGIQIIPHICGPVDEVISAFLDGCIESSALLMPGCERRKRGQNQGKRA